MFVPSHPGEVMRRLGHRVHPGRWNGQKRFLAWLMLLVGIAAASLAVRGASVPPSIPPVVLSSDPLYATTAGDKPTLTLALSVEFPTVGAQYVNSAGGAVDDTYSNQNEYLGYYDANGCYAYNNKPSETPKAGYTATDYKRFDRTGTATNHNCADAFSGNFLNWASNSAIDMLRLALSGGDRYIDEQNLTVLQRAVIPDGDPVCMWNTTNFPLKRLQRNGGSAGTYWGAVPRAMITAAGSNDIWVGNTLNRIYFGTSQGGGCGNTSSYALGSAPPGLNSSPVLMNQAKPADVSDTACAGENGTCSFSGEQEVWYGANSNWSVVRASQSISCSNAVFGDPLSGVVKACYTRPVASGSSTDALNNDGFFYSRVRVCDQDTSGNLQDQRDYTFCTRYPSGAYKPTGTIQKYSDSLRLAALGYALDQTASYNNGRYGGVLRAPMKYVGAKTFDMFGQENTPTTGNARAEWDATTGIFLANPEGDTTQSPNISGVINYLNKFGRTGPVPGRYKYYDPVGELYYESLRYLQGLPPSPAAVANLTPAMYDGFPIYTDWSGLDPYAGRPTSGNYACLKNNIVVIGDIHTHDGGYGRLPTASAASNIPDFQAWTNVVGAFENGSTATYVDGQGATRTTSNPNAPNGSPPGNEIVGTAYWAHSHDIRGTAWSAQPSKQMPGLRVKTFLFDVNEYAESSIASNRQYRNQFFTAAKYGGFESVPSDSTAKPYNPYGNPFQNVDGTPNNDVWQDPANPGEASTYFLQSNARSVLSAFDAIFARASTAARSIGGAAAQSGALTQGANNMVYQGAFDTSDWTGDLVALPLSIDTANNVALGTTPVWSAAARLTAQTNPATTRNIVVGSANATASAAASAFTWNAIGADLKATLNKPDPASAADNLGSDRLNFLRGDNSREGSVFRLRRGKLLGDIVNSGVAYSGQPSASINSATYTAFRQARLSRTPAVFVGANDGMLHAFNATTGDELFGYIPSWLGPKLSALTSKTYVSAHQSYVDATPAVAEALVGSVDLSTNWKTVLVGGTGAGGRGVYALDVSDPAAFSASSVMWEFTSADDADMGNVVSRPQILKFRTSAPGPAATYKWFAVVASGVNNYLADSAGNFSATGQPALFVLDLDKRPGTAWRLGSNYFKLSLPVDSTLRATNATGVTNFSVTLGTRQEVARLFVGDLHGNLWKLDFSQLGTANWNMGKLTAFDRGSAGNPMPYPLYIAKDAAGKVQPITAPPMLVRGSGADQIQVAFGTGKYLEVADRSSTAQNSFYVVYDNGSSASDGGTSPVQSAIEGRSRLQIGTFNSTTGTISVPAFAWGRAASDSDTAQRSGWYFDYPTAGERQVSGIALSGSTLVFGSLIPNVTAASNVCGAAGGSGREYLANVDTGLATSRVSTVGLFGQAMVMEIVSAQTQTTTDSTGRRIKTITKQTLDQGTAGIAAGSIVKETQIAGRLSWREIHNYQDLRKNLP